MALGRAFLEIRDFFRDDHVHAAVGRLTGGTVPAAANPAESERSRSAAALV
jgi:hypothetical protein